MVTEISTATRTEVLGAIRSLLERFSSTLGSASRRSRHTVTKARLPSADQPQPYAQINPFINVVMVLFLEISESG